MRRSWAWCLAWWAVVYSADGLKPTSAPSKAPPPGLPTRQLAGLSALYEATGGPDWSFAASGNAWSFSSNPVLQENPCKAQWVGLTCNSAATSLTSLQLNSSGLVGTIPVELGWLGASLAHLDLSNNSLSGPCPSQALLSLSRLTYLDLSINTLESAPGNNATIAAAAAAALPSELFQLTSLEYLDVSGNNFAGELPGLVSNLASLRTFYCFQNRLSRTLPTVLFQLSNLRDLRLFSNDLTGVLPSEMWDMASLSRLYLSSNKLRGRLPREMFATTNLIDVDLNSNEFTGSIPPEIGHLKGLVALDLSINRFSSQIPSSLFSLTALQNLQLCLNRFSGPISSSIGQLQQVSTLYLFINKLTGVIPDELYSLTSLQDLQLSWNQLGGSISPLVGNLKVLALLYLDNNAIGGKIPDELFQLTLLQDLQLGFNSLCGSLSSHLGELTGLTNIDLTTNALTSTIPNSFFQLTALELVDFSSNRLTGSISQGFSTLRQLTQLLLNNNSLQGTLPSALFQLTRLEDLRVNSNLLTGELANSVSSLLLACTTLYLHSNSFSGEFPQALLELHGLQELALESNQLSKSLPLDLSRLSSLLRLDLSLNDLTGPSPLVFPSSLTYLSLAWNRISGPIPSSLFSLRLIQTMDVSNNRFTSSPPPFCLSALPNLTVLSLANNSLSSTSLDFLISLPHSGQSSASVTPRVNTNLVSVDISGNSFRGQCPGQLFLQSPRLQKFVAAKNCLSGSLPPEICEARGLRVLILDGLGAGDSCRMPLFERSSLLSNPGSTTTTRMAGGLPACLLSGSLPNITTLHAGGNNLVGRAFPDSLSRWPPLLKDFSVAFNRLSGPIPSVLQQGLGQLHRFDVSNNQLSGELGDVAQLQESAGSQSFFSVNRFSGFVSPALARSTTGSVQVLEGNLIACASSRRAEELPTNDPYFSRYSCGSNTFDATLIAFAVCAAAAAAVWGYCVRLGGLGDGGGGGGGVVAAPASAPDPPSSLSSWGRILLAWLDPPASVKGEKEYENLNIGRLLGVLRRIRLVCLYFVCVLLVLLVPAFAGLSASFGTHAQLYSWSVSAAFVSGTAPAATFLVLWVVLLVAADWVLKSFAPFWQSQTQTQTQTQTQDEHQAPAQTPAPAPTPQMAAARLLVFCINGLFVLLPNVGYVSVVSHSDSNAQKTASFALTLFKLVWNRAILATLVEAGESLVHGQTASSSGLQRRRRGFVFELSLAAFNIVVAPAIALLTTDANCFSLAFFAPPPVQSSYSSSDCIILTRGFQITRYDGSGTLDYSSDVKTCLVSEFFLSIQPSFRYGYQCSAELVVTYSSVFACMAVFSCFAEPLLSLLVRWCVDEKKLGPWAAVSLLHPLLLTEAELLLLQAKSGRKREGEGEQKGEGEQEQVQEQGQQGRKGELEAGEEKATRGGGGGGSGEAEWSRRLCLPLSGARGRVIDAHRLFLDVLQNALMLLTFGLAVPLCGLVLAAALAAKCLWWHHLLARFSRTLPGEAVSALEADCCDFFGAPIACRPFDSTHHFVTAFASLFLAAFLADTAGDAVGWQAGLWAPVLMVVLPSSLSLVVGSLIKGVARPPPAAPVTEMAAELGLDGAWCGYPEEAAVVGDHNSSTTSSSLHEHEDEHNHDHGHERERERELFQHHCDAIPRPLLPPSQARAQAQVQLLSLSTRAAAARLAHAPTVPLSDVPAVPSPLHAP